MSKKTGGVVGRFEADDNAPNMASRAGSELAAHPLYDVLSKAVQKVVGKDGKKED